MSSVEGLWKFGSLGRGWRRTIAFLIGGLWKFGSLGQEWWGTTTSLVGGLKQEMRRWHSRTLGREWRLNVVRQHLMGLGIKKYATIYTLKICMDCVSGSDPCQKREVQTCYRARLRMDVQNYVRKEVYTQLVA